MELGRTIRLSARDISYYTEPRNRVLVPQHRYLLFLQYVPSGDFYGAIKSWELLDGKALPCNPEDVAKARKGVSKYAGMDEEQFIRAVTEAIASQKPSEGSRR